MEKYIVFFRKSFIITAILLLFLLIGEYYNLMYYDVNGYFGFIEFISFVIFIISIYSFFILTDIKKDKFLYLSIINYILLIASFVFFVIWGIIYTDPLAFLFPAYFAIITTINLIVMTIIYVIKKTGGKYFLKEWLYFLGLILLYVIYVIIMRHIKS